MKISMGYHILLMTFSYLCKERQTHMIMVVISTSRAKLSWDGIMGLDRISKKIASYIKSFPSTSVSDIILGNLKAIVLPFS